MPFPLSRSRFKITSQYEFILKDVSAFLLITSFIVFLTPKSFDNEHVTSIVSQVIALEIFDESSGLNELRDNTLGTLGVERFKQLMTRVSEYNGLNPDENVLAKVFNVLINLRGLKFISAAIRKYITDTFLIGQVEIRKVIPVEAQRVPVQPCSPNIRRTNRKPRKLWRLVTVFSAIVMSLAILTWAVFVRGSPYPEGPTAGTDKYFTNLSTTKKMNDDFSTWTERIEVTTPGFSNGSVSSMGDDRLVIQTPESATKASIIRGRTCEELKQLPVKTVVVHSAAEYFERMVKVGYNVAIRLITYANSSLDWNAYRNILVGNEENVFSMKIISAMGSIIPVMLNDKPCLSVLRLAGLMKNRNLDDVNYIPPTNRAFTTIRPRRLKALVIQNFGDNIDLLMQFVQSIRPKSLEKISFRNMSINTSTLIQQILEQNRNTLKQIQFSNTNIGDDLLSKLQGTFPSVHKLEFSQNSSQNIEKINEHICRIFPNLAHLNGKYYEFTPSSLEFCKSLAHLQYDVMLTSEQPSFNVSTIPLHLSNSLNNCRIELHSNGCKNGKEILVTGLKYMQTRLPFHSIESLCKLCPEENSQFPEVVNIDGFDVLDLGVF